LLTVKPTAAAYADAAQHKAKAFYALNDLADMKRCMAHGYPHIFGTIVTQSFMDAFEPGGNGVVPFPSSNDPVLGGHALLAVGYDDANQRIIFKNSWSAQVGDKGYGYLPYAFFTEGLADDLFTIRRM
jgi:C1A family cysteine protease